MWSNIRVGLGPARPKEGTTWFRAELGHCFTLWAGTARPKNLLGFAGPNPFGTKHDGLGPGRPGPIPSTMYGYNILMKGGAIIHGVPRRTELLEHNKLHDNTQLLFASPNPQTCMVDFSRLSKVYSYTLFLHYKVHYSHSRV
jgi:hypothetical protein